MGPQMSQEFAQEVGHVYRLEDARMSAQVQAFEQFISQSARRVSYAELAMLSTGSSAAHCEGNIVEAKSPPRHLSHAAVDDSSPTFAW
jgi:hypothetical protein